MFHGNASPMHLPCISRTHCTRLLSNPKTITIFHASPMHLPHTLYSIAMELKSQSVSSMLACLTFIIFHACLLDVHDLPFMLDVHYLHARLRLCLHACRCWVPNFQWGNNIIPMGQPQEITSALGRAMEAHVETTLSDERNNQPPALLGERWRLPEITSSWPHRVPSHRVLPKP